jgi:hypothetical protein
MDICTLDAYINDLDVVYVSCSGCSGCNIRKRRFGLPLIPRNGAHPVIALTVVVDSYIRSPPSGVQHDGGPATLGSFLRAGALDQLNLTLERGPGPLLVIQTYRRADIQVPGHCSSVCVAMDPPVVPRLAPSPPPVSPLFTRIRLAPSLPLKPPACLPPCS